MDVNERFDQWLKSLTVKDEINSSQIKGDSAAVSGGKKKDKKKETKDFNPKKGSRDDKNDTNKNKSDAKVKTALRTALNCWISTTVSMATVSVTSTQLRVARMTT